MVVCVCVCMYGCGCLERESGGEVERERESVCVICGPATDHRMSTATSVSWSVVHGSVYCFF